MKDFFKNKLVRKVGICVKVYLGSKDLSMFKL